MSAATKPELGIHPLAAVFPMIHGQEFEDLVQDIRINGLREPIVTHEDMILDGCNRYRACREAGIEPTFVDWDGKGTILGFVLSRNVQRRHMTEGQRALTAARLAKLSRGRPAKNAQIQAISQEEAAKQFRVSRATVQSARQVLDKGVPELIRAVEDDEVSVSAAASVATLDRKEQAYLVDQGAEAITSKAAQIRQANAEAKVDQILQAEVEAKEDRPQPVAKDQGSTSKAAQPRQHKAEVKAPPQAPEVDGKVDGTKRRPSQETEIERPPVELLGHEECPFRADLPEPNRARFDRMVFFYERLQLMLEAFRRDFPEIDDEVRALLAEGHEPRSTLNLIMLTKHPRDGRICGLCGGSGHGVFEDVLCIDCHGDGFLLARYGPLDMPPGADAEEAELVVVGSNGDGAKV